MDTTLLGESSATLTQSGYFRVVTRPKLLRNRLTFGPPLSQEL